MKKTPTADVSTYIAAQPKKVGAVLTKLRQTIKSAVPEADEEISYRMPAYGYYGRLVYFAAFKNHVGLYPKASAIRVFKKELSKYEGSKGAIRFPIDKPLPLSLIRKIVKFRAKENLEKQKR